MNEHAVSLLSRWIEMGWLRTQYEVYVDKLRRNPDSFYRKTLQEKGRDAAEARKSYDMMGEMLGVGMLNVIHCLDPDIIVFGGGVSRASRFFLPAMLRVVRKRCIVSPPRFAVSAGPMALLGAASLVL